ncbi:MAG: hypothetical protein V1492_01015 [Candidatus Micrarchaeota archaeon]
MADEEIKNEEDGLNDIKKNDDTGEVEDESDEDATERLGTDDIMQDTPGADADKVANVLWELESEVVKLESLVSDWEAAGEEEQRESIEEEMPKAVALVKRSLKRLDELRLLLKEGMPAADEYETELVSRAGVMLKKAAEILEE